MVFDRYLFKMLAIATVLTALTLAGIILLTQSLRFLELVIDSGASSFSFWILTLLALPRFFEVILPIALVAASVFIYNRMASDSEIVALRAAGLSPLTLARPALALAGVVTLILLLITTWIAPVSLSGMQNMRQVIKAQYSTLLFQEEIFNTIGDDLTVYIKEKNNAGELEGLIIYDSREELEHPIAVIAKKGVIVLTDEGQQVLVYDGSRQQFNPETGALNRLDFERYTIDLPESGPVRQRWSEPEERTFWQLFNPDENVSRDMENLREFTIEAHKRMVSPFLALTFTVTALMFLLLGPTDRRGQGWKVLLAVSSVIILQGLYLGAFNLAVQNSWGLVFMYLLTVLPLGFGLFVMSSLAEDVRHRLLYQVKEQRKTVTS